MKLRCKLLNSVALSAALLLPTLPASAQSQTGVSDMSLPMARPSVSLMASPTMRPAARPNMHSDGYEMDIDVSVPQLIIADVQRQIAERAALSVENTADVETETSFEVDVDLPSLSVDESVPVQRTVVINTPQISVSDGGTIPAIIPNVAIKTSDVIAANFMDDQKHFQSSLSDGGDITVALDYARILIANMMLPEAVTFLIGYERVHGTDFRIDALIDAARLLSGAEGEKGASFQWKDDSLWAYLTGRSLNETRATSPEIRKGLSALDDQSLAIQIHLTPALFETAIDIHNQFLARSILEKAEGIEGLTGTSRFMFMQGQLAELEGKEADAFSFYAKASKVQDVYGAKSVLALTSLVMDREDPRLLPEVLNILSDANQEWKGGDVSLMLLARLALVAEELRQFDTALGVMARITSEYPGSDEARLARIRMPIIFQALSSEFKTGGDNISEVIQTVRTLQPMVSEFNEWSDVRVSAAEALASVGLLKAAIAEFSDIHRSYAGEAMSPSFLLEVSMRRIEILIDVGDLEEAGSYLEVLSSNGDFQSRYTMAAARSNRLDLITDVDGTISENDTDSALLHELSRSSIRADKFDWAIKSYRAFTSSGGILTRQDAADYLRAVAEIGDAGSIKFENSSDHSDLRVIKNGITNPMPNIDRVDKNTARSMLQSATEVLDQAKDITIRGQ